MNSASSGRKIIKERLKMKKIKIEWGWKVLRGRRSGVVDHYRDSPLARGIMCYPKKRWVRPRGGYGPFCVFTDKRVALSWVRNPYAKSRSLHRCFFVRSKYKKIWMPKLKNSRWSTERKREHLPPYTVLADAVICID
jgi:hypothetical protein